MASLSESDDETFRGLFVRLRKAEARIQELGGHTSEAEKIAEDIPTILQRRDDYQKPTTFKDFIQYSHRYLSKPEVDQDREWKLYGGIKHGMKTHVPNQIRSWEEFPRLQEEYFCQLSSLFHPASSSQPAPRLFKSQLRLEALAEWEMRLKDETDLRFNGKISIEKPVSGIVKELAKVSGAQEAFDMPDEIEFTGDHNILSDNEREVEQRLYDLAEITQSRIPGGSFYTPKRSDRFYAHQVVQGDRRPLLIMEYRLPHKLSAANLRAGLRNMNVSGEIFNRDTPPPADDEGKLIFRAERIATTVVSELFSEMIENGMEYGFIHTGVVLVFLQVREDDPTTVYYHLSEPNADTETAREREESEKQEPFPYPCTAISQVLSFCLMAAASRQRDQKWRQDAMMKLQKHEMDFDIVLSRIPREERKLTPASTPTRRHLINPRPPYSFQRKTAMRDRLGENQKQHSSKSPVEGVDESSRTKTEPLAVKGGKSSGAESSKPREFCTQVCLLNLSCDSELDLDCPNVDAHRRNPDDTHHPITESDLRELMQAQLATDLDHNCEPLGKQGSRGALFRLTLNSWGYTLVGKGTVRAWIAYLQHEGRVYDHLGQYQGRRVPVCLGNIDLPQTYYYDLGVRIEHMLLLAWVGERVDEDEQARDLPVEEHTKGFSRRINRLNVEHEDLDARNVLWSREFQRPMVVDFERALWVKRIKENGKEMLRLLPINKGPPSTLSEPDVDPSDNEDASYNNTGD